MVFLSQFCLKGVKIAQTTTHSDLYVSNVVLQQPINGVWIVQWLSLVIPQGLLVKVVFTMARPNTLQVGDVITQLLDGFHLLMQIVTLNEVGHLGKKKTHAKS